MPIRFLCKNCQQFLQASDESAGQRITCPKCHTAVAIPDQDDPHWDPNLGRPNSDADPPATERDPLTDLVVYDSEIIYETEQEKRVTQGGKTADDYDHRLVAVPRKVFYLQAVLLAVLTIGAAVAGYLIGRTNREATVVEQPGPQRVRIVGNVKWHGFSGALADPGAAVLALPIEMSVDKKAPGDRLSPDRPMPATGNQALQMIEDWGGYYTRTNDIGEFQLFLTPGDYQVLIVSHRAKRARGEQPEREDLAAIGQFLTLPHEMIGSYRYVWRFERFDADSRLMHEFTASDAE